MHMPACCHIPPGQRDYKRENLDQLETGKPGYVYSYWCPLMDLWTPSHQISPRHSENQSRKPDKRNLVFAATGSLTS